jgi:hypothetical protein
MLYKVGIFIFYISLAVLTIPELVIIYKYFKFKNEYAMYLVGFFVLALNTIILMVLLKLGRK